MPQFTLGPQDGLYFEHAPPTQDGGCTFVFFNALTGDANMWLGGICPALNAAGHGHLVYNLRGQAESRFSPGTALDEALIVSDAVALLADQQPRRPVFVGLSIGGLYAARALLAGAPAAGLVLINTLREDGVRLRWINEATYRCAATGGLGLMRDLLSPLLFGEAWLNANRGQFLGDEPYAPLPPEHGHCILLKDARGADWNLPYEALKLPVCVLSGLQDRVFYVAGQVQRLSARLPNARRVDVEDGGHMLPVEHPRRVIDTLLAFASDANPQ